MKKKEKVKDVGEKNTVKEENQIGFLFVGDGAGDWVIHNLRGSQEKVHESVLLQVSVGLRQL